MLKDNLKVPFFPLLRDLRKIIAFLEGPQASLICPGKNSVKMKKIMRGLEEWYRQEKPKYSG